MRGRDGVKARCGVLRKHDLTCSIAQEALHAKGRAALAAQLTEEGKPRKVRGALSACAHSEVLRRLVRVQLRTQEAE